MKVQARISGSFPETKLVGRTLGPFVQGQEVELEIWEVEILRRHGLAEPVRKFTLAELRKLLLAEERGFELSPLPAGFYSSVESEARCLGEGEGAGELRDAFESLVELRSQKLLGSALSPEGVKNALPEERFLLNRLNALSDEWNREVVGKFVKGEEGRIGAPGRDFRSVVGNEADIQKP